MRIFLYDKGKMTPKQIKTFHIPPAIFALAMRFKMQNFTLYLVGGIVRDFLLCESKRGFGKNSLATNDFDFCTSALPHEIKAILRSCENIHAIFDIGEKYGTIGAMMGGTKIEITTFRSERDYKDNRHPDFVRFERDISADLSRRDFTINAMACEILSGQITDIFGGMADLKAQKIRAVGNANERFAEDALRILRAFSFVAKFGFEIESTTMSAILAQKSLLKNISKERVNAEIIKILNGRFALKALKLMQKNDIFAIDLPKKFSAIPKKARIYGAFLFFKDAKLRESLQNKRAKNIENAFTALISAQKIRKIRDLKRFFAEIRLRFELSDLQIALALQTALRKKNRRFKKAFCPKMLKSTLKINGFDLQNLGFKDAQIGAIKNALLVQIYSGDLPNQRAILLHEAQDLKI